MDENFRVSFESPQSGWMSLRLRAGEAQQLVLGVSHAPYDSLRDLIAGLSALVAHEGRAAHVRWNCEPEEYDFHLATEGAQVEFTVTRYADHRRRRSDSRTVFAARLPTLDLCLAFWRELRELGRRSEVDVFRENWRREFPQTEMQELTRLLRAHKREARTQERV
ncbi:MAG TPA: hypothetical protein VNA19_07745 [Pyrinomonadaceae bacterium]|jgi:hypothetical protein|nr:hypothetical protein [Pyrinomonadaceae bacterium]